MDHQCWGRGKGEGDVCECIPWLTMFGVVRGGYVGMHCMGYQCMGWGWGLVFEYISQSNTDWEDRNGMCLNASHSDTEIGEGGGLWDSPSKMSSNAPWYTSSSNFFSLICLFRFFSSETTASYKECTKVKSFNPLYQQPCCCHLSFAFIDSK